MDKDEIKLEKKIRRLNKLAREIDENCNATHPTIWNEMNKMELVEYKKLVDEIGGIKDE